jgi:cytochrome b
MTTASRSNEIPQTVKVWDPLVRIFHWSLVIGFAAAYASGEEWDLFHEVAGYGIVALLSIRVLWGFFGTRYARFRNFLYRPRVILTFLRESLQFKAPRYLGHNPAGGAMVIALLVVIFSTCISGILLTTDTYRHAEWLKELHEVVANGTIVLVVFHIGGVLLASIEHKENLVKSMFTGKKRSPMSLSNCRRPSAEVIDG